MAQERVRPTLADVAARAGVSQSSASRALNNVQPISESLREKVAQAARDVGYSVSDDGVLSRGPICAVVPDILNPYYPEIVAGIQAAAELAGTVVSVFLARGTTDDRGPDLDRWLNRSRCSGLIMTSSEKTITDAEILRFHKKYGVPIVLISRTIEDGDFPSIHVNYIDGMYRATNHILGLGHQRIAFFAGREFPPDGHIPSEHDGFYEGSAWAKALGAQKALAEAGMDRSDVYWKSVPTATDMGYQAMNRLLDLPSHKRPTAVLCISDVVAIGALHAVQSRFLRVPDDISIVGYDDIAMASHTNPPLTTVSPPKFEMGRLAVELILKSHTNPNVDPERYMMMNSPLIVRESTGVYVTTPKKTANV